MQNFVALTIDFSNNRINKQTLLAIAIIKVIHNKNCITVYHIYILKIKYLRIRVKKKKKKKKKKIKKFYILIIKK